MPSTADASTGIYQPYYKPALLPRLDAGFIPLNWMSNPTPALRELALHQHIASEKTYLKHRLTGIFSAKFFSKTGLSSEQVYRWIESNPGHDLYLISGAPFMPYQNYNGFERNTKQSQDFPGNLDALCTAIGFQLPQQFPRQTNANCVSCNYWVGTAAFWTAWHKDVVGPIFKLLAEGSLDKRFLKYGNYPAPTPVYILTLLYERLIDLYVARKQIKSIYWSWKPESVLALPCHPAIKDYLSEMIPLVDRIDRSGKSWSEAEKAWLRESYNAVTEKIGANTAFRGFGPSENLASDPDDFDLPRRYPERHVADVITSR